MAKVHPLIFEELQDDKNLLYLTLIEYKKVKYLCIVENIVDTEIQAYILDNLAAEGIDQDWFLSIATKWFYAASDRYPLSFEFAKIGSGDVVRKSLKTFNINSTSRIIGKLFTFDTSSKPKIKRRKVIRSDEIAEIKFKN
jgi:hypothetical protein